MFMTGVLCTVCGAQVYLTLQVKVLGRIWNLMSLYKVHFRFKFCWNFHISYWMVDKRLHIEVALTLMSQKSLIHHYSVFKSLISVSGFQVVPLMPIFLQKWFPGPCLTRSVLCMENKGKHADDYNMLKSTREANCYCDKLGKWCP